MSTSSTSRFVLRAVVCHVSTYFAAGLLAMHLADYTAVFARPEVAVFMRPLDSPWVAAGPAIQVIRGVVLGLALRPVWRSIGDTRRGWLRLWGLLIGLAMLAPTGAAPGSLEGVVYTVLPLDFHLRGLPEVLGQTAAFAWLLHRWDRGLPRGAAIGLMLTAGAAMLASALGVLAALGLLPAP